MLAGLLCILATACNGFDPVTENLMRPPRLTPEQRAIEDALEAAVLGDPILKYPQSGDYRSAFVFYDLDGDGSEEALVFYATEYSDYTRVCLLDQRDGEWFSPCELSGLDRDVEFVSFANISGPDAVNVVIGWGNPEDDVMTMGIYSYQDGDGDGSGELVSLLNYAREDAAFNSYLIYDLDNDGLDDVFLLTNHQRTSKIKGISYTGYGIGITNQLSLSDSIVQFAGVTAGRISPRSARRGIFIDELLSGDELVTEVFTITEGQLTPVISQDMSHNPDDLEEGGEDLSDFPTLYEQTYRSNTASSSESPAAPVCADINNDNIIEIPTAQPMPGYEEQDEIIYLTEYHQLQEEQLNRVFAAAFNRDAGYLVKFPEEWVGNVTVVNQIENGEWRFITYNPNQKNPLEDLSGELARVRVVNQNSYQDKFLESYVQLCEPRGVFNYYGYVPENPVSTLAITVDQLKNKLFSLL